MLRWRCFILVLIGCASFCFGGNGNGNNGNGYGNGGSKNQTPPGQSKNHGSPSDTTPTTRQSTSANGNYTVVIEGAFNGQGQATVTDTTVVIQAIVKDAAGNSSTVMTDVLPINGPYFTGHGTALGQSIMITGRLDAVQASRLVCTIIAQDGRAARCVGMLPPDVDPPDTNWDADANKQGG